MAGISDLLNWMDNQRRTVGRNLSDLVRNPKDYLTGVANELPNTVREYAADPMNFVGGKIGGVGMTAWHGSPHKFDKFSLDKIGTGEGAQAYGHGLYLAESPEVAATYKAAQRDQSAGAIADKYLKNWGDKNKAITALEARTAKAREEFKPEFVAPYEEALAALKRGETDFNGSLYKTDIPDEAVARFLDWDKPLSQQSEAMRVIRNAGVDVDKEMIYNLGEILKKQKGLPYVSSPPDIQGILGRLRKKLGSKEAANEYLMNNGISGIRYLDGGSRSAGQGSSNFVVFDPEMIRILERNGVTTGNQPWKPGEYRPLNDLMNVRTD